MVGGSRLVLGSAQWGMRYGIANAGGHRPNAAEVNRMLLLARTAGVDTIDTARAYGDAETVVGKVAGADPAWKIFTKMTPELSTAVGADEALEMARRSLRDSRASLGRDRLDVVLLHRPEHKADWGGAVWSLLKDEKAERRIGAIGVSATSPRAAVAALSEADSEILQVPSSLLDQRLWRLGFFDRARSTGVEVLVRSVFLQGVAFLDPAALPSQLESLQGPLRSIAEWSARRTIPVWKAFAAHAQALGVPLVVGFEREEQLAAFLEVLGGPVGDEADLAELAALVPALSDDVLDPSLWKAP